MSAGRPRTGDGRAVHVPFVLTGLACTVLGGFTLAVVLPVEAALGIGTASRVAHVQVHGHLQLVGFVALLIVGVAYHLLPAFTGRPLAAERLATPSRLLLTAGVLLRVLGQPLATHPLFAATAVAGATFEAAGALCFTAIVLRTLAPEVRRGEPTALCCTAGAAWFVVQALLAVWWVAEAAAAGGPALPAARDGLLVTLQLFGLVLLFILGVGLRSFPIFFAAARPGPRAVLAPWALWQAGLLAVTLAALLHGSDAIEATSAARLHGAGLGALGTGVLALASLTHWWRRPSRLREASRPFALPLQLALGWLTLAALLLGWLGARTLITAEPPTAAEDDTVRHLAGVGVVLTTIIAMGQLVLPEFASERFDGRQHAWRGVALGGTLALATVLRAGSRWWDQSLPPLLVNLAMAAAGVLGIVVMAAFALLYLRSLRHHRALLARFAAMTAAGTAWPLEPRRRPGDQA